MERISAWAAAHPILSWSVGGVIALIVLVVLGYGILRLWMNWHRVDRSGAKLIAANLTVHHDIDSDDIVFTCPLHNQGRHAARDLHVGMSLVSRQKAGFTASWRFSRTIAELAPGKHIDFDIRVSRTELARLASNFNTGTIGLWSNYSSSRPHKAINSYGAIGPRVRYALAVGEVGGKACVTVTDFTLIDPYHGF